MRFAIRFFLSLLILTSFLCIAHRHFSDRPLPSLSRSFLDRSLGARDLGTAFVFQMTADQQIRKVAMNLIPKRKKEWQHCKESAIPLKIHQIWPFDEPIPDELARASSLLIMQHPSFTHKLWKKEDFRPLLFEALGPSWETLSPNVVRDLAAAHILLQEGGIVVDLESECVQPITEMLPLGNCIIGFEPPLPKPRFQRRLFLSPSVIAAVPHHRIIDLWAKKMVTRANYTTEDKTVDPLFICSEALTSVVASHEEQDDDRLILLGPTFFSPVAPPFAKGLQNQLDGLKKNSLIKKAAALLHIGSSLPFSTIEDETIFFHMHGGRQSRKCFENTKISKGSSERDNQPGKQRDQTLGPTF